MAVNDAVTRALAINGLKYTLIVLGVVLLGYGAATGRFGIAIAGLIVVLSAARSGT